MTFTGSEVRYFLNPASSPSAYGPIEWRHINGTWRGTVPIAANQFDPGTIEAEFNVRPMRPAEPSLVLMMRRLWFVRLDVNGVHRDHRESHLHKRFDPSTLGNAEPVPQSFQSLPMGDTVSEDAYRQTFRAALEVFGVNSDAVDWQDPPEGGIA